MDPVHLTLIEWALISSILAVVLAIGISKKQYGNNTGKTDASLFRLTISTVVTFSSSIAMIGVPSETWRYGFRYVNGLKWTLTMSHNVQ